MNPDFQADWAHYLERRVARVVGPQVRKPDYRKGAVATVDEIIARLDAYTVPMGDCLVWTVNVDPDGYGWVYFPGWAANALGATVQGPHVFAYAVHHGLEMPLGGHVDHECFNRLCCNPNHLRLISAVENDGQRRVYSERRALNRRQYEAQKAYRAAKAAKAREIQEKLGITHLARRGAA